MAALTNAQKLAVEARGNVLVVAGAGTGKTSTLVTRCVDRIVNERASLERMLMVTFTDAAAAEMRNRIEAALASAVQNCEVHPSRTHVEEQLALMGMAQISTLSSFCLELVREHFHELHLDPQLVVLDEERLAPLIEETMDALFEEHYAAQGKEGEAAAVRQLIRNYGGGSDFAIRRLLLKIHRYTQTLANPRRWFEEQDALFSSPQPEQWRTWLCEAIAEWCPLWLPVLEELAREASALADCARALRQLAGEPTFEQILPALNCILAADADRKQWEKRKSSLRPQLAAFFKEAKFLADLQPCDGTDPLSEDWNEVRGPMRTLIKLACEFGERFRGAKRETGGLDFADIEQLALKLLLNEDGLTTLAEAIRARFDHVFVDEYQDINAAQDAIIRAVSVEANRAAETGNRFLVGDVKQSIYRFRLAQPKIFTAYDERWSDSDEGQRIPLSENFRSREAILNFVNPLFAALMRRSIGGLDYSNDARLMFGHRAERQPFTAAQDGELRRVELHLISKSPDADAGDTRDAADSDAIAEQLDLEAVEREARLIARRLCELRESKLTIREKSGVERAVEYRDMVVLMRSPSDRVEAFAKQFHRVGVPLRAARAGFYDMPEVSDLLCLLRLLDNPLQDLPLLAVLRSPIVALSPEELVEIRCAGIEGGWWPALRRFRVKGGHPDLIANTDASSHQSAWAKVNTFLAQFDGWRGLMLHSSVSQVLETALAETHYESLLAADERGQERLANARRFIDLARDYDPLRRQGLYRFLHFIDAQRAAEVDREPAPAQADNAVQLMSVHRSKGLEFPVVVLANIGGAFNEQHLHQAILLSEQFGLCPKIFPPERSVTYPSLPHWLARRVERRELLGEEMRLLYVAMTRAREMLILTGTASSREAAASWTSTGHGTISDAEILKTRSYLDWLRLWLPQVTTNADWRTEWEGSCALLRWKLYTADDPFLQSPAAPAEKRDDAADDFDVSDLLMRVEKPYPFAADTKQPAKTSVSALRREQDDDAEPLFFSRVWSRSRGTGKLAASDIGTAHHRFQQFVELSQVNSMEQLRVEAVRLSAARLIEPAQADALDFDSLHTFWNSNVGIKIREHGLNVRRELEFTARFSSRELSELGLARKDLADDFMVIQGVADLVVFLPEELWLLDFKTDTIDDREINERAAFHSLQLKLYARALRCIYGRPVTRQWLHFFAVGRTIDVSSSAKFLNAEPWEIV